MAIIIMVIIYCILCISAGENMGEAIFILAMLVITAIGVAFIKIDEGRSKKDAAKKIQKWEEYKRKNYGKM